MASDKEPFASLASEAATPSLGESAYRQLRSEIVRCRVLPGERLTERGLAQRTGLGVGPIREALKRLEHQGLVRTIPRRGYRVESLSLKSIKDLFQCWQLIGPELVLLGLSHADEGQKAEVARKFGGDSPRATRLGASVDTTLRVEDVLSAFDLLAEMSDNIYLRKSYDALRGDLERTAFLIFQAKTTTAGVGPQPAPRIDRIVTGAPSEAAEDVASFITHLEVFAVTALRQLPSVSNSELLPVQP